MAHKKKNAYKDQIKKQAAEREILMQEYKKKHKRIPRSLKEDRKHQRNEENQNYCTCYPKDRL